MPSTLKKLGPGLLFAGAAIGVSHLVQSTRAGADFGLGLLWALILVNVFKYPFFQFGPRYAAATNESLIEGYHKLSKYVLAVYFVLNLAVMFTIQTAVTIVTAGLANALFFDFGTYDVLGIHLTSLQLWSLIILSICILILFFGSYKYLDYFVKGIVLTLTFCTLIAVGFGFKAFDAALTFKQIFPKKTSDIIFLIAFMGWMPAPLDISIWHSIWAIEKQKMHQSYTPKTALFDFNIGFIGTIIIGIGFLLLGYLVMYNSGEIFSDNAGAFAHQLITLYTTNLGSWTYAIIGLAAFTTMFSTTITTLDASPRVMNKSVEILIKKLPFNHYNFWLFLLSMGTLFIFFVLSSEMGTLIRIATILSFITAPFYAICNYSLISSKHTPKLWQPSLRLHIWSWLGILFLIGFSVWYLLNL